MIILMSRYCSSIYGCLCENRGVVLLVFLSARRAGDEKAKGERREAAQALSTTKGRAKPVRLSLLVGGEYHKQPIEPERIFREGEMGDFELRQNPPPLRFSRVTEAIKAKFTEPCRRSFNKGDG